MLLTIITIIVIITRTNASKEGCGCRRHWAEYGSCKQVINVIDKLPKDANVMTLTTGHLWTSYTPCWMEVTEGGRGLMTGKSGGGRGQG